MDSLSNLLGANVVAQATDEGKLSTNVSMIQTEVLSLTRLWQIASGDQRSSLTKMTAVSKTLTADVLDKGEVPSPSALWLCEWLRSAAVTVPVPGVNWANNQPSTACEVSIRIQARPGQTCKGQVPW